MIKGIPASLRHLDLFGPADERLRELVFIGRLRKKPGSPADAELECWFQPLGGPDEAPTLRWLGVGWLPSLVIGSLWYGNRLGLDRPSDEVECSVPVEIDGDQERLSSLSSWLGIQLLERLGWGALAGAPCLDVGSYEGWRVVVPTIVLIKTFYATSTALAQRVFFLRVDGQDRRLWDPASARFDDEDPEAFVIRPHWRLRAADIPVVARMAATEDGRRGVSIIWRSCAYANVHGAPIFPAALPPFNGESTWRLRGRRFEGAKEAASDRVLLVSEIDECSRSFPFQRVIRLSGPRGRATSASERVRRERDRVPTTIQHELKISDRVGRAGPRNRAAPLEPIEARFPALSKVEIVRRRDAHEAGERRTEPASRGASASAVRVFTTGRARSSRKEAVGNLELFPLAQIYSTRKLFHNLQEPVEHRIEPASDLPPVRLKLFWDAVEKAARALGYVLRYVPAAADNVELSGRIFAEIGSGLGAEVSRWISVAELGSDDRWFYALETIGAADYAHYSVLVVSAIPSTQLTLAHFDRLLIKLDENGGWWSPHFKYSDLRVIRVEHHDKGLAAERLTGSLEKAITMMSEGWPS